MNFIIYLHKFSHICNIYDDNIMFYNDLFRFTNDLFYLGDNSAEQENRVLYIFHFQKLIQSKIELGFLEGHFFIGRSSMAFWITPGAA
jgi:hypothetical protein